MAAPQPPEQVWIDEEAGPLVRHYATAYRHDQPACGRFDLITLVIACPSEEATQLAEDWTGRGGWSGPRRWSGLLPEQERILSLCRQATSVAEVASRLGLPIGMVRTLLADLLDRGLIRTRSPIPAAKMPSERVYKAVLDGLRSL